MDSIRVNDYLTEEEKKDIVTRAFKSKVCHTLDDTNNVDRLVGNAISTTLTNMLEGILTPEHRAKLLTGATKAINEHDYSFEIFQKPNMWDRTELTAYSIITSVLKKHKRAIECWAEAALVDKINNISEDI